MAVTPITFGPGGIREVGDHRVYVRAHWANVWERQHHMQCLEAVWSCAPTLPTATLLWRYGDISQIDSPGFAWYAKKTGLSRVFVKVEIDTDRRSNDAEEDPGEWNTKKWYGVLELTDDALWGSRDASGSFASGEQAFTAYGLEKLLADHWILSSWFDDDSDGLETARSVTFNQRGKGNRSATKAGDSYQFEPDVDYGFDWSSADIVEYLLTLQTPKDSLGDVLVPFGLMVGHDIPDWDRPEISQEGQTCYSLIERIVNRKRLLLWWLDVEEAEDPDDPDRVVLKTNTLLAEPLTLELPDDPTLLENSDQVQLLFNNDQLTSATLRGDAIQQYDQVICYGARRRSVGSFSVPDRTLEKGWDVLDEGEYEDGASGSAGYAALGTKEKQKRNQDARNKPILEKVYACFQIPHDWNQQVADGEGGDTDYMFPDGLGSGEPIYYATLAIEQSLPLIVGVDYGGSKVADGTVSEPQGERNEMSPRVFFKRPESANDPSSRWVDGETLADTIAMEESDEDANNRWSVSVRVPRDSRGLFVRVHGAPQHVIATADFTPLAVDEKAGAYDYSTGMIITLSLEDDRHVEGRWPATEPTGVDCIRRLAIDAGDGYRQDYVAAGTVVDVDSDGTLVRSTGGYIPAEGDDDDVHRLTALAKVAASWYCTSHQVLYLETRRLRIDIGLGDLVVEIGDSSTPSGHYHEINSPVTEIAIAIPRDGGDPVMHVATWAGELDPMEIMPRLPARPVGSWSQQPHEAFDRRQG